MQLVHEKVLQLIEYVKIDSFSVECHFRCNVTQKRIVSEVAFEPYEGKIILTWQEILLHPLRSYNKYFHTPVVIYAQDTDKMIVLKAFEKVAQYFVWNEEKREYIFQGENYAK